MRWQPDSIVRISASLVAAAVLSVFAGCGSEGAPSPEPPRASLAPPESPGPAHRSAPPAQVPAAGGAKASRAAQIRLYLARHDLYQSWYPRVGEITVDSSGVAVVGTSLGAADARAIRKVCDAVVDSGLVAAAVVSYGRDLAHPCR
jgi:hypothetical protein